MIKPVECMLKLSLHHAHSIAPEQHDVGLGPVDGIMLPAT